MSPLTNTLRRFLLATAILFLTSLSSLVGFGSAQEYHLSNPPARYVVPQYAPTDSRDEVAPKLQSKPRLTTSDKTPSPLVAEPMQEMPAPVKAQESSPNTTSLPQLELPNPADSPFVAPQKIPAKRDAEHREWIRDYRPYPVDPRKPCSPCTQTDKPTGGHGHDFPGRYGQPYRETELGGCKCGKRDCSQCNQASVYWPRPLSGLGSNPANQATIHEPWCPPVRVRDVFDRLEDFKLIDYRRCDSGYCGEDHDPYGCLGESHFARP